LLPDKPFGPRLSHGHEIFQRGLQRVVVVVCVIEPALHHQRAGAGLDRERRPAGLAPAEVCAKRARHIGVRRLDPVKTSHQVERAGAAVVAEEHDHGAIVAVEREPVQPSPDQRADQEIAAPLREQVALIERRPAVVLALLMRYSSMLIVSPSLTNLRA